MKYQDAVPAGSLPETGFIRLSQLMTIIPLSKPTILTMVKKGLFPAPVALSVGAKAWPVEKIRQYIAAMSQEGL